MLFDSILQIVTQFFGVFFLLYLLFLFRPFRLLLWLALVIALFLSAILFSEPESFVFFTKEVITGLHLLPSGDRFDVVDTSMGEIHRAFILGFYKGFSILLAFTLVIIPTIGICLPRRNNDKK